MLLKDIITERREIIAGMDTRREEFDAALKVAQARLAQLSEAERLVMLGFDYAKITRGRKIVEIRGQLTNPNAGFDGRGDGPRARAHLVEDARGDLAAGGIRLWRQYFGIKNFEGFGDQRCDCEYGMGPRHGSIVFSVGLSREVRSRQELLAVEIDDALYLLTGLAAIEMAAREERAA